MAQILNLEVLWKSIRLSLVQNNKNHFYFTYTTESWTPQLKLGQILQAQQSYPASPRLIFQVRKKWGLFVGVVHKMLKLTVLVNQRSLKKSTLTRSPSG